MSEYAKNIQTIEDLWKKRIGLREGGGRMTEYIITDKQLERLGVPDMFTEQEIVRCRDCKHYDESDAGCSYFVLAKNKLLHIGNPDGFCAWGERRITCKCGEELESEGKCPSCGRWVHD